MMIVMNKIVIEDDHDNEDGKRRVESQQSQETFYIPVAADDQVIFYSRPNLELKWKFVPKIVE